MCLQDTYAFIVSPNIKNLDDITNNDQQNQEHKNIEYEKRKKYHSLMAGVMKTYINRLYESSIWKKDNGQCD